MKKHFALRCNAKKLRKAERKTISKKLRGLRQSVTPPSTRGRNHHVVSEPRLHSWPHQHARGPSQGLRHSDRRSSFGGLRSDDPPGACRRAQGAGHGGHGRRGPDSGDGDGRLGDGPDQYPLARRHGARGALRHVLAALDRDVPPLRPRCAGDRDALGRGDAQCRGRGRAARRYRPQDPRGPRHPQRNRDGRLFGHRRRAPRDGCGRPPGAALCRWRLLHRLDALRDGRLGRRCRDRRVAKGLHAAHGPCHRGDQRQGAPRNGSGDAAAQLLRSERHVRLERQRQLPLHPARRADRGPRGLGRDARG